MHNYSKLTSDESVLQMGRALNRWLFVLRGCVAGCVLPFLACLYFAIRTGVAYYELGFMASLACGIAVGILVDSLNRFQRGLTPLSGTRACTSALSLCRQFEEAEKIRIAALDAGRQLYEFDYLAMLDVSAKALKAADSEKESLDRVSQESACKALHGLTSLTK